MADKISKEKRSDNMSKIKSRNTFLEINFRKKLFKQGIRYRLNYSLFGKPDLVIQSKRTAVFINGCFWHQHKNCKLSYMPKTNTNFWKEKLLKNVERDKQVREKLFNDGWKVVTVWECDIEDDIERAVNKTIVQITK